MQADTPPPAVTRAHFDEARRELEEALRDPKNRKRLEQAGQKLARDIDTGKHKIPDALRREMEKGK